MTIFVSIGPAQAAEVHLLLFFEEVASQGEGGEPFSETGDISVTCDGNDGGPVACSFSQVLAAGCLLERLAPCPLPQAVKAQVVAKMSSSKNLLQHTCPWAGCAHPTPSVTRAIRNLLLQLTIDNPIVPTTYFEPRMP